MPSLPVADSTAIGDPIALRDDLALDNDVAIRREIAPGAEPAPDRDHGPESPRVHRSWLDHSLPMWSLAVGFGMFALVVVLSAQPNHYVVDNLFAWFWRPTAVLKSWRSPWDPQGGMGAARPDFSPVFVGVVAAVRAVGVSAAVAERLAHAALLLTAALGAVQVVRLFIPRVRALHAFVGFLYMVNPYTATFILPSALFLNYALAPWFVYVVVRGVRDGTRWRYRGAAAFALLVFAAGLSNVPGLAWALLPLVPTLVYVVWFDRQARVRDVVLFFACAAGLTVLVMAAGLVKMQLGAPRLTENLNNTETVGVVTIASSWTESWRGLGFWLSYWSDSHGLAIARSKSLLTSPVLVAATFAWPIAALATLRWSRWRPRLLFAGMMIAALVGMVGLYPYAHPTPFGRILQFAYDHIPSAYGFRNSYKAGAGLMLGIAVLVAVGITQLLRRSPSRKGQAIVLAVVAAIVISSTYPFWIGGLYGRGGDTKPAAVPAYYPEAFSWLDAHLDNARVLILPGTANSWYRWGYVGDDIVNAYMSQDYVLRGLLPSSNAEANSVVAAVDDRVNDGTLQPGMIGPIARRLGIRYVMLRNDLDWQRSARPRPAALATVRDDPDLVRVATFGARGENVTDPADRSDEARAERRLPPVEIYAVDNPSDPPQVVSHSGSILLAGDGSAWPLLARNGNLRRSAAIVSTRDLTPSDLATALFWGADVVVTDTDRRATSFVTQTNQETSYTLGRSEVPGRGLAEVDDPTAAQTVATYSDARDVREITPTSRSAPDARPALAFDGDKNTAWLADAFSPVDARLHIDLKSPRLVSHANLVAARPLGDGRNLTGVDLRFSDGSRVPVDLTNGKASVSFPARRVSWIEIVDTRVAGAGVRPIGLSEVSFPHLSFAESIALPEDIFKLAASEKITNTLLSYAPFRYQFERQRTALNDVEPRLDRTFRTAGEHAFTATGTLELDSSVSDALVDASLGGTWGAHGSDRYGISLENSGPQAFDGRNATAWVAPATAGTSLTLRFPRQTVRHLTIRAESGPGLSRLTGVHVTVGGVQRDVALASQTRCASGILSDPAPCTLVGEIDIPATVAQDARVDVATVDARPGGAFGLAPIRVAEVEINHAPNDHGHRALVVGGCIDNLVEIDGHSIPIKLQGTRDDLLAGRPVAYVACRSMKLDGGEHALHTTIPVDDLTLNDHRGLPAGTADSISVFDRTAAAMKMRVTASGGDVLKGGISFDSNWKATLAGETLPGPIPVDGESAWRLPHTIIGETVQLSYRPQRTYNLALLVSFAGLLLCGFVLMKTRTSRQRS